MRDTRDPQLIGESIFQIMKRQKLDVLTAADQALSATEAVPMSSPAQNGQTGAADPPENAPSEGR